MTIDPGLLICILKSRIEFFWRHLVGKNHSRWNTSTCGIPHFRALTKLVSSLRSSLSLSGGINCEIIMSIFPKVTGGRKEEEGGGKG